MTNPRILLLGGHGKVSLLLTPKLVSRSWDVISVIRKPEQKNAILEAGKKGPGKIEVLIESLEDLGYPRDFSTLTGKPDLELFLNDMRQTFRSESESQVIN